MPIERPEEEASRPEFALLSILRMVAKRKVSIGITWFLLTAAALAIVWSLPSIYSAEAVILVDSQKIPEKFVSATVATNLQERIATIKQQIMSSAKLKKIIDDFGLYRAERKTYVEEEILEMMRKDITITLEKDVTAAKNADPNAFRVGYQGRNPALVAEVANRLTTFYIDENLKTREVQAEGTSDFMQGQLAEAKKRLDELEAAVSSYKLKHNGELPEQAQSLAGLLSRLQVELEANRDGINRVQQNKLILENSLTTAEASLAALTQALTPSASGSEKGDPGLPAAAANQQAPRKKSEILQEQLDLVRLRYRDDHPDVLRLRAAIESLKKDEEKTPAAASAPAPATNKPAGSAPRPVVVSSAQDAKEVIHAREQVSALRAQVKAAEKEVADRVAGQERILRDIRAAQSRMEKLPVREQEMAQITRDYEISKTNYKALLDKKLAAEMALDMERRQKSERFTVIDAAKVPEIPIKPKRPLLYAIGSVASLALALLLGFVREARENVILGEWELPDDCLVLARLPYIEILSPGPVPADTAPPGKGRGRKRLVAPLSAALLSLAVLIAAGLYFFQRF